MSKTVAFVVIGILAAIGVIGAIVLTLYRPDATATFIGQLVTVLTLITTAAGTLYGLGKVSEKVEQVQRQTNGNLSRKEDDIAARDQKIAQLESEVQEHRLAEAARTGGEHRA